MASYFGFEEIAKLLLKCGAKVKVEGSNAVDYALSEKHYAIAELLQDFIDGNIKYAPEECPSHPDYVESSVSVDVMGEVY